jgi:hypothetical protein
MLRRLPRRLDRIGGAVETGRLSVNVRVLAESADRRYFTGMLHQVILTALAATAGIMFTYELACQCVEHRLQVIRNAGRAPARARRISRRPGESQRSGDDLSPSRRPPLAVVRIRAGARGPTP